MFENVILMLNPFVPHISKALWEILRPENPIEKSQWPQVDENALIKDEVSIVIQVNGKLRANMIISTSDSEDKIKDKALLQENIKKYTTDKEIIKTIKSAVANAENNNQLDIDSLIVKEAYVGKGITLKRFRPRAKGRAASIKKHFSNLTIIVSEKKEAMQGA